MAIDYLPFHKHGYQLIPKLFDTEAIGLLRAEALRIRLLAESASESSTGPRLHNILSAHSGDQAINGQRSLHIEHVFRFSPRFRELIHDSRLVGPVQAVCDPDLRLLDDQLYWKPSGVGGPTYIHRDSDFFGPLRVVTAWIPLGPVDETNGCLWAVPGSHRLEQPLPGVRKRAAAPGGVSPDRRPFDYFYEVDWPAGFQPLRMNEGDVLLLHRHALHCSLEVRSDRERLAYLVEYVAVADLDRHRENCPGLFEYHDRWQYMVPVRRPEAKEV